LIINDHQANPGKRNLQRELGKEITTMVHSEADFRQSLEASEILFGKTSSEVMNELSAEAFDEIFEGVPSGVMARTELLQGMTITELLVKSGFLSSNSEARRAIQEGSISVNKVKTDADKVCFESDVLACGRILLQRGKKSYYILTIH